MHRLQNLFEWIKNLMYKVPKRCAALFNKPHKLEVPWVTVQWPVQCPVTSCYAHYMFSSMHKCTKHMCKISASNVKSMAAGTYPTGHSTLLQFPSGSLHTSTSVSRLHVSLHTFRPSLSSRSLSDNPLPRCWNFPMAESLPRQSVPLEIWDLTYFAGLNTLKHNLQTCLTNVPVQNLMCALTVSAPLQMLGNLHVLLPKVLDRRW